MKNVLLSCTLVFLSVGNAQAASTSEAVKITKEYSELIACALPESDAGYSVVQIEAGSSGFEDDKNDGAIYLIHWIGDTGCHKGSGTGRSNYTLVADTLGSGPMLVANNYVDAGFGVNVLESITVQDDIITIKGTVPGESKWDQKPVTYKVKHSWGGKLTKVE